MPPRRKKVKEEFPCCKKRTPTPSPSTNNRGIYFRRKAKLKPPPPKRKVEPGKLPSVVNAAGVDRNCACHIVSRALNPKREPPASDEANDEVLFDPIALDQEGPVVFDKEGNRVTFDEEGKPIVYNREGNEVLFDQQGKPIVFDKDGNQIVFDKEGYPILFNNEGNPIVFDKDGNAIEFDNRPTCDDRTSGPLLDKLGKPIHLLHRNDIAIKAVDSRGNALPPPEPPEPETVEQK